MTISKHHTSCFFASFVDEIPHYEWYGTSPSQSTSGLAMLMSNLDEQLMEHQTKDGLPCQEAHEDQKEIKKEEKTIDLDSINPRINGLEKESKTRISSLDDNQFVVIMKD